jgi:hypothetical protein
MRTQRVGKNIAILATLAIGLSVTACAQLPAMKMTDALQKLEDAQKPCDFPLFYDFDTVLKSDQMAYCRDQDGLALGFKMTFFEDSRAFDQALSESCTGLVGPLANSKFAETNVLFGNNWLLTSDIGSKYSLTELKGVLGGSEGKMSDLCR